MEIKTAEIEEYLYCISLQDISDPQCTALVLLRVLKRRKIYFSQVQTFNFADCDIVFKAL